MVFIDNLGCGFKYFLFSPLFGEDFQFDSYFSDGLVQPPTRYHIDTRWFFSGFLNASTGIITTLVTLVVRSQGFGWHQVMHQDRNSPRRKDMKRSLGWFHFRYPTLGWERSTITYPTLNGKFGNIIDSKNASLAGDMLVVSFQILFCIGKNGGKPWDGRP